MKLTTTHNQREITIVLNDDEAAQLMALFGATASDVAGDVIYPLYDKLTSLIPPPPLDYVATIVNNQVLQLRRRDN